MLFIGITGGGPLGMHGFGGAAGGIAQSITPGEPPGYFAPSYLDYRDTGVVRYFPFDPATNRPAFYTTDSFTNDCALFLGQILTTNTVADWGYMIGWGASSKGPDPGPTVLHTMYNPEMGCPTADGMMLIGHKASALDPIWDNPPFDGSATTPIFWPLGPSYAWVPYWYSIPNFNPVYSPAPGNGNLNQDGMNNDVWWSLQYGTSQASARTIYVPIWLEIQRDPYSVLIPGPYNVKSVSYPTVPVWPGTVISTSDAPDCTPTSV